MHRVFLLGIVCTLLVSCDNGSDRRANHGDAGSLHDGPAPATEHKEDEAPGSVAEATWHDAYRECRGGEDSECLRFERCVRSGALSVCASSCQTTGDCVGLEGLPAPTFTAKVECAAVAGEKRCHLACGSTADCPSGMTCEGRVCFWK